MSWVLSLLNPSNSAAAYFWTEVSIILFSFVVPIGILIGRSHIRASRQEIVKDLEQLFTFAKKDGKSLIIPSLELVKYKYDPDTNPHRAAAKLDSNSYKYYSFPVLMYVLLTCLPSHFLEPRAILYLQYLLLLPSSNLEYSKCLEAPVWVRLS
jgi:hypothetical protein